MVSVVSPHMIFLGQRFIFLTVPPTESPAASRSVPPTPPPSPTTPSESATNHRMLELTKMVRQVQEVLPHIAENIIRNDLSKYTSTVISN